MKNPWKYVLNAEVKLKEFIVNLILKRVEFNHNQPKEGAMEAIRREKILKKLREIATELESYRPKTYERLVDITEELFLPIDARVVLVMNVQEYNDVMAIFHKEIIEYRRNEVILDIKRNVMTPHGEVEYVIIDDSVKEMYGFTIDNPKAIQ